MLAGPAANPVSPFTTLRDGVCVAVRVAPRAAVNRIGGVVIDAGGAAVLRVSVTAAPEGGKANAAVIKLLSKAWRVPKGAIRIAAGGTARRKVIHVSGVPDELLARMRRTTGGKDG